MNSPVIPGQNARGKNAASVVAVVDRAVAVVVQTVAGLCRRLRVLNAFELAGRPPQKKLLLRIRKLIGLFAVLGFHHGLLHR